MTKTKIGVSLVAILCSFYAEKGQAASSFSPQKFGNAPIVNGDPDSPAANVDSLKSAVLKATPFVEMRYRYENVDQDGFANEADANTLRTLAGFKTAPFHDFSLAAAISNTMPIGDIDYNDGINKRTQYPRIGDPIDTELQLANLTWTGLPRTSATVGRQYLSLDNQRFVGNSNFRQNRNSFDAVTVKHELLPNLELFYGHVFFSNRAPGTRSPLGVYDTSSDLFHVAYNGVPGLKLSGYSYLVNLDHLSTASAPTDIANYSSATTGVRAEYQRRMGDNWGITGAGEYARQVDYGNNPRSFGLDYYTVEPGITAGSDKGRLGALTLKSGFEVLSGNGTNAVQTPLASMHNQNGWGDIFGTTPVNGLEDAYVTVAYKYQLPVAHLSPTKFQADWHDFNASHTSLHYGSEWNLGVEQPFLDHFSASLQYADYSADHYAADTQKIWLTLQMNY